MRILFIGIFDNNEPNTAFRNALRGVSDRYDEIAHISFKDNNKLQLDIINKVSLIEADLVFMQLQGPDIVQSKTIDLLKEYGAFICQWTGDARQPLPQHYIDFGKKIDLSLFTNYDDVEVMRKAGVKADYLQVSADDTIYNPGGSVVKCPEIVFMGNNYGDTFGESRYRQKMVEFLQKTYGSRFGVYGANWKHSAGNLMFQQEREAEVYRSCKIAINCSHYDLKRYTSDRFFRILLSGSFCLSKEFPDMEEFKPNENFVAYDGGFDDLRAKIDYYLHCEGVRTDIAQNGCLYAHKNWTWADRINKLLKLIENK